MAMFELLLAGMVIVLLLVVMRLRSRVDLQAADIAQLKEQMKVLAPGQGAASRIGPDVVGEDVAGTGATATADEGESPDEPEQETGQDAIRDKPGIVPPPLPVAARTAPGSAQRGGSVDLESLIGGRWSVLLGGVAVALGALFLVRYSIEAGLLGPGARIVGGALLAAGLLAFGERLRRKDGADGTAPFMSADIPGVLTGAGAIAAFGTVYAAHGLYGYIGPAVGFVALTAIGLACLLLASIHGPKLAAIGMLGAFAAPALTATDNPNQLALALHVLVVTASVIAMARIRGWRWLALAGIVGSLLWTMAIILFFDDDGQIATVVQIAGLAVIFAIGFGWRPAEDGGSTYSMVIADVPADRLSYGAFVALCVVSVPFVLGFDTPLNVALVLIVGLVMAGIGLVSPSLTQIVPWVSLLTTVLAGGLQLEVRMDPALFDDRPYSGNPVPPDFTAYLTAWLVGSLPVALLALWGSWRAAGSAPGSAGYRAAGFALVAVLGLAGIYLRISDWETSWGTASAAIVLAAISVGLTEAFTRRRPGDFAASAPAVHAVAAVAFLALAMGVVLTRQWLPLGMGLTSLGVAWIYRDRPFPALPKVAVILAALAFAGLYFNAPFERDAIGTTPFFNMLIVITGVPALALILAGEILRRSGAGRWADVQTAIGLALLALFVSLELRHFTSGGEIGSGGFALADMAAQSMAALGFAIGLQFAARRSGAGVFNVASLVAGGVGVFMLLVGLGIWFNPLLSDDAIGQGRVFNLLLPGYLLTGLLAGIVCLLARGVRPRWYRIGYGAVAGILMFLYASLMVRHGFQGERLGFWRGASDGEVWTYSVVWLALGGVVLAAGLFTRSLPLRIASAGLIFLTIAKVFLIDMSALTGALRAFSFIGLGLVLIVIGRFYQRILSAGKGDGDTVPPMPANKPDAGEAN